MLSPFWTVAVLPIVGSFLTGLSNHCFFLRRNRLRAERPVASVVRSTAMLGLLIDTIAAGFSVTLLAILSNYPLFRFEPDNFGPKIYAGSIVGWFLGFAILLLFSSLTIRVLKRNSIDITPKP